MNNPPLNCIACDASLSDATEFTAQEMMYGTGESFKYLQCKSCNCLQIAEAPSDLSSYYPEGYYSGYREPSWKTWLKGARIRYGTGGFSPIGSWVQRRQGPDACSRALTVGQISKKDPILDVGGGNGTHLRPLYSAGYRNLLGIDPYAAKPEALPGFALKRLRLEDVSGSFKLIMMHHAFEHMSDPLGILKAASERLQADGIMLIRIPVLGEGWRRYGVNWVELDAPRHIHLHTKNSFSALAERAGLAIVDTSFDSTALEIWGSEQYLKGIHHADPESYDINPTGSIFTPEQIQGYYREVSDWNAAGISGRAAFILRKIGK